MPENQRPPARPAPHGAAEPPAGAGLVADDDQPLIAVPLDEDGRRRVASSTSEAATDAAVPSAAVRRALDLAEAWADPDWVEALAELGRIRHQSPPTPPADEALGTLLGAADEHRGDEAGGAGAADAAS
jgi:hypothetical protein